MLLFRVQCALLTATALATALSIPGSKYASNQTAGSNMSNDDDIYCYQPGHTAAVPVSIGPCTSSIDYIIRRDGAAEFERRQPFYFGPGPDYGAHRVPDHWIGIDREPSPCEVKLTVIPPDPPRRRFQTHDFFKLAEIAQVAQRILTQCVQTREKYGLGGEGYVGNRRGFIVVLNGVNQRSLGLNSTEINTTTETGYSVGPISGISLDYFSAPTRPRILKMKTMDLTLRLLGMGS